MCLSTVFEINDDATTPVFDSVKNFTIAGGVITFTDILGDELIVQGNIERVDFEQSAIYVAVSK